MYSSDCIQVGYKFNKPFAPYLYNYRNKDIMNWCDIAIIFYRNGYNLQRQLLELYNLLIKNNKKVYLIDDK